MKNLFSFLLLSANLCLAAQTLETAEISSDNYAIQFEKKQQDLGEIVMGQTKKTSFKFTNTGSEDIKIEIVSGCSCTTLDWTRKAIKPGEAGEVLVAFDSNKKEDPIFEEEEVVDVDIDLKNVDPKTGYNRFERVTYKYILKKK